MEPIQTFSFCKQGKAKKNIAMYGLSSYNPEAYYRTFPKAGKGEQAKATSKGVKKQIKVLNVLWGVGQLVEEQQDLMKSPQYIQLPSRDAIAKLDPDTDSGKDALAEAIKKVARFMTVVKSDPEASVGWAKVKNTLKGEGTVIELLDRYGLGSVEMDAFNNCSKAILKAIKQFNNDRPGLTAEGLKKAVEERDEAMQLAVSGVEYVLPLYMQFEMLPREVRLKIDTSTDTKIIREAKATALEKFRFSAMEDYKKTRDTTKIGTWSYKSWRDTYIKTL